MSLRPKLQFLFVPLMLLALIVGCSDKSTKTTTGTLDLNENFGGYKATSESPAFGEPTLLESGGDVAVDNDASETQLLDSLDNSTDRNIYSVELAWGHLQYDSLETATTDWSGSLSVERGAIVAIRLFGFEGRDHIVMPRTSRTVLQWVSRTREHFDGMLVYLYDPAAAASPLPNTLTFTTAPYTRTFTTRELDSLSEVVDVGANQFSIEAFKVERLLCKNGFIDGRWIRNGNSSEKGEFMGRWISRDGTLFGHVKGSFGVRSDGSRVLFGKWISASRPNESEPAGTFRGLLRGEWGHADVADSTQHDNGWMRGGIFDRNLSKIGEFSGRWISGRGNEAHGGMGNGNRGVGHGFLRGRWSEICQ